MLGRKKDSKICNWKNIRGNTYSRTHETLGVNPAFGLPPHRGRPHGRSPRNHVAGSVSESRLPRVLFPLDTYHWLFLRPKIAAHALICGDHRLHARRCLNPPPGEGRHTAQATVCLTPVCRESIYIQPFSIMSPRTGSPRPRRLQASCTMTRCGT